MAAPSGTSSPGISKNSLGGFRARLLPGDEKPKPPTEFAVRRVHDDIARCFLDDLPGIQMQPDDDDMMVFHVLIKGVEDTPYHRGSFYFHVRMPHDYPFNPPTVSSDMSLDCWSGADVTVFYFR